MKSSDSKYSICFLQKGFREKRFTPMDVTQHALKQARAHSQIFTQVCEKEALIQANESTQRWRHGTPASELDGIPFAVKDLFDIKGYATTRGSTLYSALSDSTSPQVLALIESGAVLIGKTNLSEFAYSGLGLNPHFGTPTHITIMLTSQVAPLAVQPPRCSKISCRSHSELIRQALFAFHHLIAGWLALELLVNVTTIEVLPLYHLLWIQQAPSATVLTIFF